jgi:hypothetical protein
LRSQLNEARYFNSDSASPPQHYVTAHQRVGSGVPISPSSSGLSPPGGSPNGHVATMQPTLEIPVGTAPDSPGSQIRGSTGSPEMPQANNSRGNGAMMDMLFSGWDPDLPDPDVLNH